MQTLEVETTRNKIRTQEVIQIVPAKSKTQLLLEKMERGEYVSDNEYFDSIPGFYEELDKDYIEVLNTPKERRITTLGEDWDV